MAKRASYRAQWTPTRLLEEAGRINPSTMAPREAVMAARPHPGQGFRICPGTLGLARPHAAARPVGSIRSILENGPEWAFLEQDGRRRVAARRVQQPKHLAPNSLPASRSRDDGAGNRLDRA